MAKPGSAPTIWASDATFASGPEAGNNTKGGLSGVAAQGLIPGVSTVQGPQLNELWNMLCLWASWVNDGSAAADEDAHIVETDADGRASLWGLDIAHGTDSSFAIEVTGAATSGTALVRAQYTGGASDYATIRATSTATGAGSAYDGTYTGGGGGGSVYYGNAVTQAVGVFVAECSNNDTPGFALAEFPTAAGDFRWSDRSGDSTTTTDGDMWLALSMATPDHDDPLRFRDGGSGTKYVHSSADPHLLTSEARDSNDSILSRTISSYISMVDRQYYARGSDTIRVRAGLSISSNNGGVAEVRLVVNGVEVDRREWDSNSYFPTNSTGEDFDLIMCSDVSEAAVSASGLTTVALQWRETGSGTIYSARSHIEVYRGFNQD